jgi:asparagine synthase (glutamine-hydrolysing)
MCGICGVFRLDGAAVPAIEDHVLARMTDAMRHRGPDDSGLVVAGGMALGARRLSIIDVEAGHQPMSDETGRIWGAQNGEIYNHDHLRGELSARGHRFSTRCDTEVLPHLYEEHGSAMCRRLRGKFGVAVWDTQRSRGLLARDRPGIKPLYYAIVGPRLIFGSELKSVIASGLISDELDLEAIVAYLSLGFVPAPMTPLADVRKLMPGECLIVEDGTVRHERYWTMPAPTPNLVRASEQEWADRLLQKLDESVEMRLMSDVPLGAMLSGGLDSSLIVALMAKHMDQPVKTFSIGFAGQGDANELDDARRVATALGCDHHELELPIGGAEAGLGRLVWHLDEPIADLSGLGFLALCDLASEHVTVALSGQGADELLGGYRKHRVASLVQGWQRVPGALRAAAVAAARRGPAAAGQLAGALQAPDPAARLLASSGLVRPDLAGQLFSGALAEHADAATRAASARLPEVAMSPLDAALYLDMQLGLPDDMLHYFDRTSMASSLEVRIPFLDHEVIELCAMIPGSAKAGPRYTKRVLRQIARGLVPDFVLTKPKLGFFRQSVGGWLTADGDARVETLLMSPSRTYERVLDRRAVERIVSEWRNVRRNGQLVLALIMLELWMSEFLPRAFADTSTQTDGAATVRSERKVTVVS